jgi:predicted regulator of Ras-like GTPase activity (Roadblock/LC7/MglB family)
MTTLRESMEAALREMERSGGINASAIVSRDGLLMSSSMHTSVRAETFAAMSATMLGAAETASSELKKGVPDRVIVETKDGNLIVTGAGSKALLVALTAPQAMVGPILVNVGKAAEKVKELLG